MKEERTTQMNWVGLAVATALAGCGSGAPEDPNTEHPIEDSNVEEAVVESTTVARVPISETHTVEIIEYSTGDVGVLERLRADLDTTGPRAADLAAADHSFVTMYNQLVSRSPYADQAEVDLDRLQVIDERYAAWREANAGEEAVSQPDHADHEHDPPIVEKSHTHAWGNYSTNSEDWTWFSGRFCTPGLSDNCEVGWVGPRSAQHVSHSLAYHVFNQHDSINATAWVGWDPCYDASFWDFCTKPWRTLANWSVPPNTVFSQSWFATGGASARFLRRVEGNGNHWGWSINFFNP